MHAGTSGGVKRQRRGPATAGALAAGKIGTSSSCPACSPETSETPSEPSRDWAWRRCFTTFAVERRETRDARAVLVDRGRDGGNDVASLDRVDRVTVWRVRITVDTVDRHRHADAGNSPQYASSDVVSISSQSIRRRLFRVWNNIFAFAGAGRRHLPLPRAKLGHIASNFAVGRLTVRIIRFAPRVVQVERAHVRHPIDGAFAGAEHPRQRRPASPYLGVAPGLASSSSSIRARTVPERRWSIASSCRHHDFHRLLDDARAPEHGFELGEVPRRRETLTERIFGWVSMRWMTSVCGRRTESSRILAGRARHVHGEHLRVSFDDGVGG